MSPSFKSRQISFLFQNIVFTIILYGVHSYLLSYFATETLFFFPLWQVYLFHLIITTILYTIINYKFSKTHKDIFVTFMAITLVKMLLAIVFLLPLLLSDFVNKQPDVFNFFIPYFLYLFFEVYSITKFLQKQ